MLSYTQIKREGGCGMGRVGYYYCTVTAVINYYLCIITFRRLRKEQLNARLALLPLIQAEEDRR